MDFACVCVCRYFNISFSFVSEADSPAQLSISLAVKFRLVTSDARAVARVIDER